MRICECLTLTIVIVCSTMNILEASITRAGGVSALAHALEQEPNTVSNWRSRGIPEAWERVLSLMQKHQDGVFSGGGDSEHLTIVGVEDSNVVDNPQITNVVS